MARAALRIVESASSEPPTGPPEGLSYDSLFAATMDSTVIVDALNGSVITANGAAARLCGFPRSALAGMPLPTMLEGRGPAELRAALDTARMEGTARLENVRFRGTTLDLNVRLSLARMGKVSYVLAHLSPVRDEEAIPEHWRNYSLVYDAIDTGAAVLVVTDADLNLLYANSAFLGLIEADSLHEIRGQALSQWLELPDEDLERMRAQVAARETAIAVSIRLHRTPRHGRRELQALAIAVPDATQCSWGFRISEPLS